VRDRLSLKTLEQIEEATLQQISEYVIPARASGLVGTIWGEERYTQEIAEMRKCLISPRWCQVVAGGIEGVDPYCGKEERTFAMVASDGYYALFFDPATSLYALGFEENEKLYAFMYGDPVSTFLAR
jgi:hypothetical protein